MGAPARPVRPQTYGVRPQSHGVPAQTPPAHSVRPAAPKFNPGASGTGRGNMGYLDSLHHWSLVWQLPISCLKCCIIDIGKLDLASDECRNYLGIEHLGEPECVSDKF